MRFGVLGTGEVGQALGKALVTLGHEVKMGGRDAANQKAVAWAQQVGPRASAGTFGDAARFGEMSMLATLGSVAVEVLTSAGVDHFKGKVVIDVTNPLDFSGGHPRLSVGFSDSLGERVQWAVPGAHVVKAFNTVGHPLMFRPDLPGGPPDMFVCGNDDGAKSQVANLLRDFGWGTVDIGGIEGSRYLEPMCLVWVLYGVRSQTWNHAFKLLRK
jgi:predicted dinucleotide-binding enzyme